MGRWVWELVVGRAGAEEEQHASEKATRKAVAATLGMVGQGPRGFWWVGPGPRRTSVVGGGST